MFYGIASGTKKKNVKIYMEPLVGSISWFVRFVILATLLVLMTEWSVRQCRYFWSLEKITIEKRKSNSIALDFRIILLWDRTFDPRDALLIWCTKRLLIWERSVLPIFTSLKRTFWHSLSRGCTKHFTVTFYSSLVDATKWSFTLF